MSSAQRSPRPSYTSYNGGVITSGAATTGNGGGAGSTTLPTYNRPRSAVASRAAGGNGKAPPLGTGRQRLRIKSAGESGRRGFHPLHFLRIIWKSSSWASMLCNFLWPVVPAAIAVRYALPTEHVLIFSLAYVAMVPCANLVGFAGQELARKFPHVYGVLVEITFGSVVEIILFMVLLRENEFLVIQAAILGSILATMLLCMGLCFIAGGMKQEEATFSHAVSEAASGLLLTAGVALAVPTIYEHSIQNSGIVGTEFLSEEDHRRNVTNISRLVAVLLMVAYGVFAFFQARTHHGIYDAIFEHDEHRDTDKYRDRQKDKLTLTECVLALSVAIALVTVIAIALVLEIEPIVEEHGISDPFMGLILVPLVEKFAEHLTAIDEAWDDQMNFAMSHVLGATLQTALFNGPLTVVVAWALGKDFSFDFQLFDIAMLLLAIITVSGFLRDEKSNYLEGFLSVMVYVAIAVAAYFYPNPHDIERVNGGGSTSAGGGGEH